MNAPAPRIEPTPGRIVHFHLGNPAAPPAGFHTNPKNLYAAMVAAVFEYEPYLDIVNLTVSDAAGFTHAFQLVKLVQAGMPVPGKDPYPLAHWCEWMPYQKGQAAKTEQLERQLGATPFNLQQAGRITRIDSLRLAAKGLEMVAAELEEKEKNPLFGRIYLDIVTQLRATAPLIEAVANAYVSRIPAGDGSEQALPPINEVDLRATSARNNERSDPTMNEEHKHGHHHHHDEKEKGTADTSGTATQDSSGGPSSTSSTSTNVPADQVGEQNEGATGDIPAASSSTPSFE